MDDKNLRRLHNLLFFANKYSTDRHNLCPDSCGVKVVCRELCDRVYEALLKQDKELEEEIYCTK